MLKPEYSLRIRPIPQLLMTWPPASSRHQQLCYWLLRINVTDKNTHMINLDKLKWKFNVLHLTSLYTKTSEVWWCHIALRNLMNVESCHGLSPVWCRATRWSVVNLFLVRLTLNQGWGEYAKPEYPGLNTSTSTLVWVRVRVLNIQSTKFMSMPLTIFQWLVNLTFAGISGPPISVGQNK